MKLQGAGLGYRRNLAEDFFTTSPKQRYSIY